MKSETWKIIAIVFILLFVLENVFIFWSIYSSLKVDKLTNKCYYDFCANYEDAQYYSDSGLCQCYGSDLLGNPKVEKERLLR